MNRSEKIEEILDTIRPALRSDGGDVELVDVRENKVLVRLKGACQGCPSSGVTLKRAVTVAIRREMPEIEEVLEVMPDGTVRQPPDPDKDPWAHQQHLEGIKLTLAVASGKGGVGKSTVAVNIALALQHKGLKVGMLDADIYGPSMPTMLNVHKIDQRPTDTKFKPARVYGLTVMSMGFLAREDDAMIWRGPMITKALDHFIHNVLWGELDCLVIDLPPGTGDAQLTIAQRIKLDGAIIITTPSDVALIDARRGLKMFSKVNVPVIGIAENMSYFICPHCNERTDIFSAGGGKAVADKLNTLFLGEIPLDPMIRRTGDQGKPVVEAEPASPQARYFSKIADVTWEELIRRVPNWDKDACRRIDLGTVGVGMV